MIIKLEGNKSEIVGGITKVEVVGGITRYYSPEEKQALFFNKLLAKLHEVSLK